MTNNHSVLNITRRFRMNRKQAMRAIEQCACAWVEENETVRDLTLSESIAARNQQAREREPLASIELPGLMFEPPRTATNGAVRRTLVQAANQFVAQVC